MLFQDMDRIVFAGDSVTDMGSVNPVGEGDNLGHSYVRIIENLLAALYPEVHLRITNCGISGNTSRDLLARWERDVRALNPQWVSICIGINDVWHHYAFTYIETTDAEFEALLGRPIPESKIKIDRNMTLGELSHGRSPLGWAASAVLGHLLRKSMESGKPDLNILFQYNMPLRALAKMTNGAISMGMVDGIVMELQGFWIIGLVRVIFEAVKNLVLNSRMEERLKNS